jgi:hypothetical protein
MSIRHIVIDSPLGPLTRSPPATTLVASISVATTADPMRQPWEAPSHSKATRC